MRPRHKKDLPTAFFDIGHSMIRLAVVAPDLSSVTTYETANQGFAKGKVIEPVAFSAAISALTKASSLRGNGVRAIVNIPSLQTRIIRRTLQHRCGGAYRYSDFASLHEAALEATSNDLDEVLDVLYTQVTLDDKPIHSLGFGLTGREIKAQALLATHPKVLLADILSAMNAGGIEVSEFRSNIFGLARALQTLRPAAENSVLIDVGHSTTTGVVSIGGSVQQVFTVAAGGHHMTRDLMVGLNTDYESAEQAKESRGLFDRLVDGPADRSVDFSHDIHDHESPPENRDLGRYLKPRVAEILSLSAKNFAIYARALDGGILFCGNGAQIPGLSQFAFKNLGVTAPPFVCQLTRETAEAYLSVKVVTGSAKINSGWLSLFSQAKHFIGEQEARRFEREAQPLSRLRPLWTWLSELSR